MASAIDENTGADEPLWGGVSFEGSPGLRPADRRVVSVAAGWLGGSALETVFKDFRAAGSRDGLALYRRGGMLLGHLRAPFVASELAANTRALYERLLAACEGRHLWRIWNYVPQINAFPGPLENYQAFCVGRSLAFEHALGRDFPVQLPAASAVGSRGREVDLIFVAGETRPTHFENPAQVPAYRYPEEHGPRSPSFARATVGRDGLSTWAFLSGTAAIRGHQTVAPGALAQQLECTLENLRLIAETAGLGANMEAPAGAQRHFKVYLRRAGDYAPARAQLERTLFRAGDDVIYLQADICRAALDIEIEATLAG